MNDLHLQLCASPEWATYVERDLVPWALSSGDLGDDVLELGPGPGLTTDVLRRQVQRLTVVEVDPVLADALAARLRDTNVTVVCRDAADTRLDAGRFTAATCFTMLHHVPSPEHQDRLFLEVGRVLRPGALFVGTDALDTPDLRSLHVDDVFVPVDPETLGERLEAAGFEEPTVAVHDDRVHFTCRAPSVRPT